MVPIPWYKLRSTFPVLQNMAKHPRKTGNVLFACPSKIRIVNRLETKLEKRAMSTMTYGTESWDKNAWGAGNKVRKQITPGKSYEIWLAEKKASANISKDSENNCEGDKNTPKAVENPLRCGCRTNKSKTKWVSPEGYHRKRTKKTRGDRPVGKMAKSTLQDLRGLASNQGNQAVLERQRARHELQREHEDHGLFRGKTERRQNCFQYLANNESS